MPFHGRFRSLPGKEIMAKMSILRELWEFARVRKKWWLGPILLFLVLFGALIVIAKGSAVAPFIYTLF
jgi:hypothetical protein